jgi:flagellar assembly protein FliH
MANIINAEASSEKKIEKFSFAKLPVSDEDHIIMTNPFAVEAEEETLDASQSAAQQEEQKKADETELLEKIDQLTSDVVRLQMELEKSQKIHQEELERVKAEAYEAGKTEAIETFQQEMNEEIESLKSQLIRSITLLDEKSHTLETSLKALEEELLESAFLIAKKVILKEVDKHSAQIATLIAHYLLKQIEESSSVTLKVNPEDFTYISNQFKESNIKIESDEAIQKGGVVLLGGEENIDGTILTRYQQALQFLQKES